MTQLSDLDIESEIAAKRIVIEPFDRTLLQPSSLDIKLDNHFKLLEQTSELYIDPADIPKDLYREVEITSYGGVLLKPGEFVLASTIEELTLPDDIAARIEGKSSLGRIGLMIHSTAGFVDPGWTGQLTLELSNIGRMPILLRYGMRIGQLSFNRLSSPVGRLYGHPELGSKYQGQSGPTEARSEPMPTEAQPARENYERD